MAEHPWLTIIGLGEDGPEGLAPASLDALIAAEIVMGPPRHLSLLNDVPGEIMEWPVPFADGVEKLLGLRGRRVAVLASGDPFWFGAGSVLARHLEPGEWVALPGSSCFSLAAARLGWPVEATHCLGLHAAPLTRLRPHLGNGQKAIVTLRDGDAVTDLADYLNKQGFGASTLHVMQRLGGPKETVERFLAADSPPDAKFEHPVCVAIDVHGGGEHLTLANGRDDTWFDNDGQITKRPVRALTLSALAPRHGEHLWDIGGGSGSISIEWLLSDPSLRATSIEADPDRAQRILQNAHRLGQDRIDVVTGTAPAALDGLQKPDVVFVGGGISNDLLDRLSELASGARIVANGVTLEAEAILTDAQRRFGGDIMRIEIANAAPLGQKRGWRSAYPIVQWSGTL